MTYRTTDGNPVPESVAQTFDDAGSWDTDLDPTAVQLVQTMLETEYVGYVDGERSFVTQRGHASPALHYRYVLQADPNQAARPSIGEPLYYGDDNVTHVHQDMFAEHVTAVSVVLGPNERVLLGSRSGVVWDNGGYDTTGPNKAPQTALELATPLLDASTDLSIPDRFKQARSGWHSSMEQSRQSERINALSQADIPAAYERSDIYPYVVRFGDTNNICSVSVSLYGNEEFTDMLKDVLDGTRSRPGHAGVK